MCFLIFFKMLTVLNEKIWLTWPRVFPHKSCRYGRAGALRHDLFLEIKCGLDTVTCQQQIERMLGALGVTFAGLILC